MTINDKNQQASNFPSIQRRTFVGGLGTSVGGVAVSNAGAMWLLETANASTEASINPIAEQSNSPEQFKLDFAQALKTDRFFKSIEGVGQDLETSAMVIEGQLPKQLKGRFYRNGPALFERGEKRYQHWFAGDGMVQQFTFNGESIRHRGRFVKTEKFKKEEKAQQFLLPAFGSHIQSRERITGPDSMNVANINALEHGGKLLALWEAGSAFALDANTLETIGPVTWQDGWAQMPFSAHPKVDSQGHLWNVGTAPGKIVSYQIHADGKLAKAQVTNLTLDKKRTGGMVHDMAVTQRYLVVPIPPVVIHWDKLFKGALGTEVMTLTKDEPLRFWVAPKDDITQARFFELPSEMVFHVGNAYDQGDEIVLNYAGGVSGDFLGGSAVQMMRGKHQDPAQSILKSVRLNIRTGAVRSEVLSKDPIEFPRPHPAYVGVENQFLLTLASWTAQQNAKQSFKFDGIQLVNQSTGKIDRFNYGQQFIPEEHVLVPKHGVKPDAKHRANQFGPFNELDSWVLGTAYDVQTHRTCVNVFEAQNLAGGPIARAWLPYGLPLGFHGNFHG